MIDKLIYFSIKNKIIIGLFSFVLVVSGMYSLFQIPIDALPDITNNQVQIITNAPSFSAQEVERLVTARIEISLANLQNVEEIRSISRFGLSVITVVFDESMPVYLARQLVAEKIKNVEGEIPKSLGTPKLAPITTGLGEIYQYVIKPKKGYEEKYDITALRSVQDWLVKRRLAGTEGVVDVSSFGGKVKQFEVAISPEKLRASNLSINEVLDAIQAQNENTGGSYIEKNMQAYFIRGEGLLKNLQDIENIVVQTVNNLPILVKDIAQVRLGYALRYGAMSQDAKGEVAGGIVMMLKGENSAKVIANVKERIAEIQKSLPEGLEIETFLDRSNLIERSISTVVTNLIEGGLIVILVLVLFLGNLRAGFIVASVIPLSMFFAFTMMHLFGISANLMSLGAIDFGLVVDGAVIIVEAILHRLHQVATPQNAILSPQALEDAVYQSSIKIRKSAAFGEIIILIVYLPILSLIGIEGKMFRPMAQTVGFAIIGALILSLTYVPMASALFLSKKINLKPTFSDKIMQRISYFYKPILVKSLRHKWLVLGFTFVLFVISLVLLTNLGGEFIPELDEGDYAVEVRLKAGTSLAKNIETSQKLQKILLRFPEIKTVISKIGTSEIPTDPMPLEASDLMIILKDKSEWKTVATKEELTDTLRKALEEVVGVSVDFQQPIAMRFNELMTGIKSDIALKIYGEDLEILFQKATECAKYLRKIKGVVDLKIEQLEGVPQMLVQYKRDKIAQYGLNIKELNATLKTAFAGEVAGQIYEGEKYFDLVVKFEHDYRKDLDDLKNLYITLPNKAQVPLEEVAEIDYADAPMEISRDDTKRRITIGFNAQARDVESIVTEAKEILGQKVRLPIGYYFKYGGQFENLEKAKQRLMVAIPVALCLIFILLYLTFHSFAQSVLIFTAIPLSAIGGIWALYLRGMPFSISAGVGFIALFGVAVLNGIVLISFFNQLQQEGMKNLFKRILVGTQERLRPVVMTAAVASLGFLPMALAHGAGAEVQKPLATVVIGGLISATLLTLILLPILYSFLEQKISVKPQNTLFILMFVAIFLCPQTPSQAQKINLEQAIAYTLENNLSLKNATKWVEINQQLEKTSIDLPKAIAEFQYGNINDRFIDNSFFISQGFFHPIVYRRQAYYLNNQTQVAQKQFFMQKNELIKAVKMVYYQWLFEYEKLQLLQEQEINLQKILQASETRVKTGEAPLLEKISIETQWQEIKNHIAIVQANGIIQQEELKKLMNLQGDFQLANPTLTPRTLGSDTLKVEQNPTLNLLKQQILLLEAQTALQKTRLLPDFKLGYFNMSLAGKREQNWGLGYQVVQVGMSFPIWRRADKARIQSTQIMQLMAQNQLNYQKNNLQKDLAIYKKQVEKLQKSLNYYQTFALPQANLILQQAEKSFRAGEIGYIEMMQGRLQAFAIKQNFLDTLLAYNQAVIQIEFLVANI